MRRWPSQDRHVRSHGTLLGRVPQDVPESVREEMREFANRFNLATFSEDIEMLEINNNFASNENCNEDCNDKDMIELSINKDNKIEVLNGKLMDIEKCHKFYYHLNVEKGLSGVTNILYNNLKIIGILCDNEKKKKMIEGIYINREWILYKYIDQKFYMNYYINFLLKLYDFYSIYIKIYLFYTL